MHWRNIHIQNPYKNQGSQISITQRQQRPRRYTPTRKDSNQSRLINTSYEKSSQSKINNKKINKKTVLSNDNKYVVTQDWIITLKKQIHNLVINCRSLCDIFKIQMMHMNKLLKISAEQMKEQIIKKMADITYNIAMINLPKMSEQHIQDGSIHIPTDGTIKQLLRPFAMSQMSLKDQLSQFGSITKIRTKNSIKCQNNQNNPNNNGYLNLIQCKPETLSPTRPRISDKSNTLKKSCSLGVQMQIQEEKKSINKQINNQRQHTEQTHQKEQIILTKQNIRGGKPSNFENCIETLKKQLHRPKQGISLKQKTTKQSSADDIMNPLDLGSEKSQSNSKGKLVSLRSSMKNNYLEHYNRQSKTERKFVNNNKSRFNDPQKHTKKKDMEETMTAMNQCIVNLKKILQKPA